MQRMIKRGASGNAGLIFHFFAQDSAAAGGAGKASVVYSSWSCRYIRNGEAISGAITPEDISTIGTYAAPTANTNVRIKAVDNTNMIGVYEMQIHSDWVNATNSCQSLTIYLTATGVAPIPIQIILVAYDPQDSVRMGCTSLPNAAAEASGGLFTRGTGAGQINQDANGRIDANVAAISTDATAADNLEAVLDGTGGVTITATGITLTNPINADVIKISGDATAADNAESFFDGTGYAGTNNTIPTVTTVTNLTNAATSGDLTATMKTSVGTAVATQLVTYGLDHLVSAAVVGADVTDNSIVARLVSKSATADWDTYVNTTDSLEALRDRGDAAWITATGFSTLSQADIRTAVGLASANLDTQISTLSTLNAAGVRTAVGLASANLDTQLAGILADTAEIGAAGAGLTAIPWNVAWDAEVQSECEDALAVYDGPTLTEMNTGFTNLDTEIDAITTAIAALPTATANADALLKRDWTAVSGEASRSVLNALRFLRNKWSVTAGTLTVTKENDTTTAFTAVLDTDTNAEPIVGYDPT